MLTNLYLQHTNKTASQSGGEKGDRTMSEKEKQVIEKLAKELPNMTERERGYLEGTIATAAAMSTRKREEEKKP